MTEKKQPLSHKGGEVEPGQYPDLGETAKVKQMPFDAGTTRGWVYHL